VCLHFGWMQNPELEFLQCTMWTDSRGQLLFSELIST
jgi:hypothetical protein